jgi:hypothetical protein
MPRLSELVTAKERLIKIKIDVGHKTSLSVLDQIKEATSIFKDVPSDHDQPIRDNISRYAELLTNLFDQHIEKLDREIMSHRPACIKKSEEWARAHTRYNPEEWLGFLKNFYNHDMAELHDQIYTLTNNNSAWQHPIMLWQMDRYDRLESTFGYYPIYVVDRWLNTSVRIRDLVTPQQERKIRIYDLDRLMHVPTGCMAMIISKNHFTHSSNQVFAKEIPYLAKALRPGGILGFNYNDCEISGCASMFENGLRSFQEATSIRQLLEDQGLKVIKHKYIDSAKTVWIEAIKPGDLTSIKRSEALGIITPKQDIDYKHTIN